MGYGFVRGFGYLGCDSCRGEGLAYFVGGGGEDDEGAEKKGGVAPDGRVLFWLSMG